MRVLFTGGNNGNNVQPGVWDTHTCYCSTVVQNEWLVWCAHDLPHKGV